MTITKNTLELQPGDIVVTHGMRCLLDQPTSDRGNQKGTFSVDALVLNPDEVRAAGVVPFHWLQRPDGSMRWTIQGNELARWVVEDRHDCRAAGTLEFEGHLGAPGYGGIFRCSVCGETWWSGGSTQTPIRTSEMDGPPELDPADVM